MKYLAILGRNKTLSLAELESLYDKAQDLGGDCASFESADEVNIDRLGGCLKLARLIDEPIMKWLTKLPDGKIVIGVSDYSKRASGRTVGAEALKLKKILTRHGRSVRVVLGDGAVLSTATVLHNGLGRSTSGRKVELIRLDNKWYASCGVQDIDAYAKRDQARPARDAKVGMLPPKLAQILINLCGPLPEGARVLDPFCGTGVVLQEALLMGYRAYGTDVDERMIKYTQKNLEWLNKSDFTISVGDATKFVWEQPIDAVACETYLGPPLKTMPTEVELKEIQQEINPLLRNTLRNLVKQLKSDTPVVMAVPAWLRPDGEYLGLNLLDETDNLGYNVKKFVSGGRLLYHREGQVVAREIIVLRKK
ncbi:methyltransferase domain-containing protein [Candidatus Saccharibacteria bacterium]|nr:methyltransferase domain-containing protein [Candidatus Saccharibacteria bacterium]